MEERIIELEKKMAFQEVAIEDLNQAVIDQQKKIDSLEGALKALKNILSKEEFVRPLEEEEPPPHY